MSVHQLEDSAASRLPRQASAADDGANPGHAPRRRTAWFTAAVMLAAVGGVYLVQQHWTHLSGNWVYLILLACPLMHLFMHGGHGGHGGHGDHHRPMAGHGNSRGSDNPGPKD